jgi:hypothetical protein
LSEGGPYPAYLTRGPCALPPPPRGTPVPVRFQWLRRVLRPSARDLAAWELFGELSTREGECELLLAGVGLARDIGVPRGDGIEAARIEWREAVRLTSRFNDALRRRIWPLGKTLVPGAQIIAAGHDVNERAGLLLPSEVLIAQVRAIAHQAAAAGMRRRHAG